MLSLSSYHTVFLYTYHILCFQLIYFLFYSFKEAIQYAREGDFDVFLAVGGGSVMDTAKAANLYFCHPDNDFLDFVNAPIGKGLPITKSLKPLLCGKFLFNENAIK